MKIIIVGCGKIGNSIIESLAAEGHDVVGIDNKREVVEEITNIYDVMGFCGNGADSDTLSEAGVSGAELFVAVTGSDEMNMLACFLARKLGACHTIARIRNPEYNDKSLDFLRRELMLSDSLNPELLCARELFNILKFPSAVNIESFSGRNFEMIEFRLRPDSVLDGMNLVEMRKKYDAKFLVCTVTRDDRVFIPDGSFVLRSGDKLGIAASPSELLRLFKMLDVLQKKTKSVMILGASKLAFYLAKMLTNSGYSVKIIERDREKCVSFSAILPEVTMICGDGAEHELLREEGIDSTDAFVALTGMDEENILISFYATSRKVPKVIAKVNRPELASMAEKLGLETLVSPKKMVSDVITGYARALEDSIGSAVETLYKINDGKAEILEFSVQSDFEYVGIPLRELKLKKDTLVGGILRGRSSFIPTGNDTIQSGDNVVIVSVGERVRCLADIVDTAE